jgi:hypothetical protein
MMVDEAEGRWYRKGSEECEKDSGREQSQLRKEIEVFL